MISEPSTWVDAHGDRLFRYALSRIRDPRAAEDLIQETFLAAFKSRGKFKGESSELTWMTGILRNKIFEHLRRQSRGNVRWATARRTTTICEGELLRRDRPLEGRCASARRLGRRAAEESRERRVLGRAERLPRRAHAERRARLRPAGNGGRRAPRVRRGDGRAAGPPRRAPLSRAPAPAAVLGAEPVRAGGRVSLLLDCRDMSRRLSEARDATAAPALGLRASISDLWICGVCRRLRAQLALSRPRRAPGARRRAQPVGRGEGPASPGARRRVRAVRSSSRDRLMTPCTDEDRQDQGTPRQLKSPPGIQPRVDPRGGLVDLPVGELAQARLNLLVGQPHLGCPSRWALTFDSRALLHDLHVRAARSAAGSDAGAGMEAGTSRSAEAPRSGGHRRRNVWYVGTSTYASHADGPSSANVQRCSSWDRATSTPGLAPARTPKSR